MTETPLRLSKLGNPSSRTKFLGIFLAGLAFSARAQNPSGPTNDVLKDFSMSPNRTQPSLNTDILDTNKSESAISDSKTKKTEKRSADYYYEDSPSPEKNHWTRGAVGVLGLYSNNGISPALVRKRQDTVLISHAAESGFGLAAFLDFGTPSMQNESWRASIGLAKFSLSPDSSVSQAPGQLEDSMGILQLSLLYRISANFVDGFQTLWYGFGGQVSYAFSASRPESPLAQASNVVGSYGIGPIIAIGADIPISTWNDVAFSAEWHPFKGFALRAGLRTTL